MAFVQFLSLFIILFGSNFIFAEDVVLQIPNGKILGRKESTITNKSYFSFQKVPYAKPPIGPLRFQAPQPVQNWDGVLNATKLDVICYQLNENTDQESEDCLYLNVYTPQLPNGNTNAKWLPVMVWIYGGGFVGGHSSAQLYGPEFLLDQDVIVVTFNYRVGIFGFLSTQDDVVPGNYGLKDQFLALQWVNQNIEYFGGDSKKTIIFGESAGSSSVMFQLLNRKSEGLYRGAICQSGSVLNPWSFRNNPKEIAFKLIEYLNNTTNIHNNSTLLHEFLLTLPAKVLEQAAETLAKSTRVSVEKLFTPVIEVEHDDAFVTRKIYKNLRDGRFVKVPVIIGINSEEAINYIDDFDFKEASQRYDENLELLVPDNLNFNNTEKRKQTGEMIRKIYTDGKLSENLGAFVKFLSDSAYNRGIIQSAEVMSKYTNVYLYQFSYDGLMGNISLEFEGADKVAHFEEVRYLWHMNYGSYDNSNLDQFPTEDIITHRRLLKLWTNFAKTLYPTPETTELLQNITWTTINSSEDGDLVYLDIGENLEMRTNLKNQTYHAWKNIYGTLVYDNFE